MVLHLGTCTLQVGSHEKMGMVIVPLSELVENVPKLYNGLKLLKNVDPNDEKNLKSRGEITFEILFKPFKDVRYFSSVLTKWVPYSC